MTTPTLRSLDEAATRIRGQLVAEYVRHLRKSMRYTSGQTNPVGWWKANAPELIEVLTQLQLKAAVLSDATVAEQLKLQDAPTPEYRVNAAAFAGRNGGGGSLEGLVANGLEDVATAFDAHDFDAAATAWDKAESWLRTAGITAIADIARSASTVAMLAGKGTYYVRVVHPPCCARCVVLAGKKFHRPTAGFPRHPGCDCSMVAVHGTEDVEGVDALQVNPGAYFDHLSHEDQDKLLGKAGAQAVRDGASFGQVVNARRGMSTVADATGKKYSVTNEGVSKRGFAAMYLHAQRGGGYIKTPGMRYRRVNRQRLTPETIYRLAEGNTAKARVMLHQNGYLADVTPDFSGLWGDPGLSDEIQDLYKKIGTALRRSPSKKGS